MKRRQRAANLGVRQLAGALPLLLAISAHAQKLLWSEKSPAHYVAAPVAHGDTLYLAALGPFQSPLFQAFTTDGRIRWTKQSPLLKGPVVCAPAVAGDRLVFGDGMHQSDGGNLYCFSTDGTILWRLPVPGKLVHLESRPVIAGKHVLIGAGQAGLLCVALGEQPAVEIQRARQQRWAELHAKYEADRKRDPDFAVPPNEADIPVASPTVVWQAGKEQWHVDSPLAVAGDRVLAGSAFLDGEKTGERAVICVKASDGSVLWKTPMQFNPWGGPVVSGQTVVVTGSSIRLDPKQIPGARGEVVALSLTTGKVIWRKEVRGGILSAASVADGQVLATATDGKVRAWDLATGEPRWQYDAGSPFFAGATVAGDFVYAAGLKGVVQALSLADGELRWKLSLTGMFYSSPVAHAGRLYLATCNLEADNPTNAVYCIGEK